MTRRELVVLTLIGLVLFGAAAGWIWIDARRPSSGIGGTIEVGLGDDDCGCGGGGR